MQPLIIEQYVFIRCFFSCFCSTSFLQTEVWAPIWNTLYLMEALLLTIQTLSLTTGQLYSVQLNLIKIQIYTILMCLFPLSQLEEGSSFEGAALCNTDRPADPLQATEMEYYS